VNKNVQAFYNNKSADRWLAVRLELIGAASAGVAALFAIQAAIASSKKNGGAALSSSFASLAGLSLTYVISLTGLLQACVRSFAQLEAGMNSGERILYYT
jgi:uncharacterized membrane protein HdeD (DUF308 family)